MSYSTINVPPELKQRFKIAAQARGFKTDTEAATEAIELWIGDPKKAAAEASQILNPKPIKAGNN